jgi:hypothetical protein
MNKTVTLEHSEVGFKSNFPLERPTCNSSRNVELRASLLVGLLLILASTSILIHGYHSLLKMPRSTYPVSQHL